jgi:hypothetical protein
MSNKDDDVVQLINAARDAGVLGTATASSITGNLGSLVIAGAAGKALEDITASEVTLFTVLIDASGSIAQRNLDKAVREGQHALLDALGATRERDGILLALWTFNNDLKVLHGYLPVTDAARLDERSYRAIGGTRLYDGWCDALAANVAYAQRLRDGGTPCKSVVVVVTDGEDTSSSRSISDCEKISRDVLASELFTLAFVGLGDEASFERVARGMGVPDGNLLVQKQATPQGLRKAFALVSRSAVRASQGRVQPGAAVGFFSP